MRRIIISAVGMELTDRKILEEELNNPKSDKVYFVLDKPVTISEATLW